jgi:trk system potassium uptake protein TrkA
VINPHATVAKSIAEALEDRVAVDHETELQNQLCLKRVHVPARHDGETLDTLDLPDSARGVALIRDDEESLIEGETPLRQDDFVLMVLARDDLDRLSKIFRGDKD